MDNSQDLANYDFKFYDASLITWNLDANKINNDKCFKPEINIKKELKWLDNQINHSKNKGNISYIVEHASYAFENRKKREKLLSNQILFLKYILSGLTISTTENI